MQLTKIREKKKHIKTMYPPWEPKKSSFLGVIFPHTLRAQKNPSFFMGFWGPKAIILRSQSK